MSDTPDPPSSRMVVRVPAGSSNDRMGTMTIDNVQNFLARVGISSPNLMSGTSYNFHPISRLQQMMEWAYRGSWIVGAACDVVAEDMTRAGVVMNSDTSPDDIEQVIKSINDIMLWQQLCETIKWARLYGGAMLVMLIDGQDISTPLNLDSIDVGMLKGFVTLDRWMVQQTFNDLVMDYGPDYGMPRFYDVIATAPFMPRMRIHYSRLIRIDGVSLPFRQKLAENGWGMSVCERLWDRLLAFDSGTMGTAQLLYKAYLRTYKVKGYRQIIANGGKMTEGFVNLMDMMRLFQSNEGMTVIDSEDEFETHEYSFGGLADTLMVLGQQISGALGIPLVRLFGQSPAGLNSTGESDLRNYYDMINASQESRLRRPLTTVFNALWRSTLGVAPPDTFAFKFTPLRLLDESEKAEIAERDAAAVVSLHGAGIISTGMALRELKQSSIVTGRFTNISAEDIASAEEQPDPWDAEAVAEQQSDVSEITGVPPGGAPGAPGAGGPGGGPGGGGPPGGPGGGLKLPNAPSPGLSSGGDGNGGDKPED